MSHQIWVRLNDSTALVQAKRESYEQDPPFGRHAWAEVGAKKTG
jgi:hypothetical protein